MQGSAMHQTLLTAYDKLFAACIEVFSATLQIASHSLRMTASERSACGVPSNTILPCPIT